MSNFIQIVYQVIFNSLQTCVQTAKQKCQQTQTWSNKMSFLHQNNQNSEKIFIIYLHFPFLHQKSNFYGKFIFAAVMACSLVMSDGSIYAN